VYLKTLMGHRNKSPADCYPFLKDGGDDLSTWRQMPIYRICSNAQEEVQYLGCVHFSSFKLGND